MTIRNALAATALFTAGTLTGALVTGWIPEARADAVDWSAIAKEPEFRTAVVEVINSCIVDNSIIYCN